MQAGLRHDTPRAAAPAQNRTAQRRCIVTGEVRPREELLRFVVDPSGRVIPDITGRAPGRGIWLTPDREAVRKAVSRKLFARAARRAVEADPALDDVLEGLLASRCVELIGLARRAGQAVSGFEKVRARLKQGQAAILIEASDAAVDGREKLQRLAAGVTVLDCLTSEEMGRAFGRDQAVHAMLAPGALAQKFELEARKLKGFRA
jgi:predicted RNA-binding protein YlxR (DUF448 family)/ribosomal protein L7Ae-like RNA K-turn-binding protein